MGDELTPETQGWLAAKIESSDGTMYPGITVVNQKTGFALRRWLWYPEFVIVMLVPHENVLTGSIRFEGKETLANQYRQLLDGFDDAVVRQSINDFAALSTQAVALNAGYLLNPYAQTLMNRLNELDALGLNVGHTGTVCGILYPNTPEGHERASEATFTTRQWFSQLRDVKVVTTPRCLLAVEPARMLVDKQLDNE